MSAFRFADTKALIRQTVHDFLAVDALYTDDAAQNQPITVRWHDKINRFGNMEQMGWAERIEGIDRIIFNKPQLEALGIVLTRNATVTLVDFPATFSLEVREPENGPVEDIWIVVRL